MEKGRVEFDDPNFRRNPIIGQPGAALPPLGGPTTTALYATRDALIAAALAVRDARHNLIARHEWQPERALTGKLAEAMNGLDHATDAYRRARGADQ